MKIILILFIISLAGCGGKSNPPSKVDISVIQSELRRILNSPNDEEGVEGMYGAWKSESSNTILLIGKDNQALVLNVAFVGDAEHTADGKIQIKRTFPASPPLTEVYGVLQNGQIIRQKYDYMEILKRKNYE